MFILHWLGNACDLEKRNGAIRDPSQIAGITRDFQSEYSMRIYSAYSVCWFTIFGPLKYGSRSLSEINPEISLEKREPGKLTVITKARLEIVFSVACTRKIAKARQLSDLSMRCTSVVTNKKFRKVYVYFFFSN